MLQIKIGSKLDGIDFAGGRGVLRGWGVARGETLGGRRKGEKILFRNS